MKVKILNFSAIWNKSCSKVKDGDIVRLQYERDSQRFYILNNRNTYVKDDGGRTIFIEHEDFDFGFVEEL